MSADGRFLETLSSAGHLSIVRPPSRGALVTDPVVRESRERGLSYPAPPRTAQFDQ